MSLHALYFAFSRRTPIRPFGRRRSGRRVRPIAAIHVTLDIRQAHVRNGMVTVRLPTRTHVVGIRWLDLRHPTAEAPLDLAAVLVYSDYQPFSLQASARPTGGVADTWETRLEF